MYLFRTSFFILRYYTTGSEIAEPTFLQIMGRDLIFTRATLYDFVVTVTHTHHLNSTHHLPSTVVGRQIVFGSLMFWNSVFAIRNNKILFCCLESLLRVFEDEIY